MIADVARVDPIRPDPAVIERAAAIIRRGGLVAFPTETVYGLGANALDETAVRSIFAAKRRALDDPVIVHVASADDLAAIVRDVPPIARVLADRFWPGPLTLVLPKQSIVPDVATAGLPTVATRLDGRPLDDRGPLYLRHGAPDDRGGPGVDECGFWYYDREGLPGDGTFAVNFSRGTGTAGTFWSNECVFSSVPTTPKGLQHFSPGAGGLHPLDRARAMDAAMADLGVGLSTDSYDFEIETRIAGLVESIERLANVEGTFDFWPGGPEAEPWLTAYATFALTRASAATNAVARRRPVGFGFVVIRKPLCLSV